MPFQGIEGNVLSGGDAHEESEPHYRGSPESDYVRKRRQRSTSSTEEVTGWSPRRAAGYDGTIVDDRGTPGQSPTSLPHRYSDRHPEPSPINNSDGTSGSSRGLSEDTLTVRRREANRLAAQRFRSRKKGYQDSLEEKVRQLEEDKELLIRRLTEASGVTLPIRRTSTSRHHDDRIDSKNASRSGSSSLNPPASPDHRDMAIDSDVRIASLESANRRLQDELRVINEENDKLREELDYWRRRERDQREASWAIDGARREGMRSPHDISPITDSRHGSTPTDRRNVAPGFPFHNSFPNGLMSTASNLPLRSPTDTNHPTLPSPGFRLPPIRLPPLKTTSSSIDRAGSTVGPPPYLPRAIELDHVGLAMMQPPVSRPVASSEEDRRRRE